MIQFQNKIINLLFWILIYSQTSFAQVPGTLDVTFGTKGIVVTMVSKTWTDFGYDIAVQKDNKIIAVGVMKNGLNNDFLAIRYKIDGQLDETFGTKGIVNIGLGTSSDDEAKNVFLQPDGKIVIVGLVEYSSTDFKIGLIRLNPDGKLDNTYGTAGKTIIDNSLIADVNIYATAQDDGKVVIVGTSKLNNLNTFSLVRVDKNGMLDSSFGTNGKVIIPVNTAPNLGYTATSCLFHNGKIMVCGYSFTNLTSLDFALARYNLDGTIDSTFGKGGVTETDFKKNVDWPTAIAIQGDKILVSGYTSVTSSNNDFLIIRYTGNGILDTSFGTDGKMTQDFTSGSNDVSWTMVVQPDSKIIVGGYSTLAGKTGSDFALARFQKNGALDDSFGKVTNSITKESETIDAMKLQQDGKLLIIGAMLDSDFYSWDIALARYNTGLIVKLDELPKLRANIYPNPFNDNIYIDLPENTVGTKATITVTNVYGQSLKTIEVTEKAINLAEFSNFPNGIYLLTIESEGKNITQKIVKSDN